MNRLLRTSCILFTASCLLPVVISAQDVESITMKQAVERALLNSREVALAQVQYNASRSTVAVERAAFKPSLFTGSGAAYTYGFPETVSGAAPSIVNVSYLQSLFNPSLLAQAQAAENRSESQRLELEKTRNAVIVQTISSYLELAKVRHALELMRTERESNTRILNLTRQRVTEGNELPVEVTKAELAGAQADNKTVKLQGRQRILEGSLAAEMGLPLDMRIEVAAEPLPFDENERDRDLIDRAVANSLDLQQADLERKAREARLRGEVGSRWPTLDLFGEYALFSTFNNFQQYFQKFQRNNFNFGVQVRVPIITAQRSANVSQARSELTVAEAQLRSKRQNVELDVSSKIQQVREMSAAREVARLELKLAQENLQVLQSRFEEGKISLRDIERARIEENEKWLAFLDSDFDRQKAQLELLNVTGNLAYLLK